MQCPGEVADLGGGRVLAGDADAVAAVGHGRAVDQLGVGGARDAGRVRPVGGRDLAGELVPEFAQGAGDGVQLQVVGAVDQPVLQLDVEVPPGVRPRGGLQPGARGRHHGRVLAGRRRRLVELDPVEALQPDVRQRQEALPVEPVPPGAMRGGEQRVRDRGCGLDGTQRAVTCRRLRVGVRDGDVQRAAVAPGALPPRGDVLAARQQRLDGGGHLAVLLDDGGRVARVAVRQRLEVGTRADGIGRVEEPAEALLARTRGDFDGEQVAGGVDEGAELQSARGGGDRAFELGGAQSHPPLDAGDGAGRFQSEVADRQPGEAEEGAELGAVVLDLGVLDVETDGRRRGARLGVDAGAEAAVAQIRALVPGLRQLLPEQIGVVEDGAPAVIGGVHDGRGGGGRCGGRGCRLGGDGRAAHHQGAAERGAGGENSSSGGGRRRGGRPGSPGRAGRVRCCGQGVSWRLVRRRINSSELFLHGR